MIHRAYSSNWLLISQVDHAHLAAQLAERWGNDDVPRLPMREELIPAIRDHDEGWRDWENHPEVHSETGHPRSFTEMTAATATALWERSIDICRYGRRSMFNNLDVFQRHLKSQGQRLTTERAIVAEEVFSTREPFDAETLLNQLPERDDGGTVSRASVYRTLSLMIDAGLLKRVSLGRDADAFQQLVPLGGGSPLGGIWASRHFTELAERSLASSAAGDEMQAFIDRQRQHQQRWSRDAESEFAAVQVERLSDVGCRFLQMFDWISLWLCCEERTETETIAVPEFGDTHWTPLRGEQIAVEPYPFADADLDVGVTASIVPNRRYETAAELRTELNKSRQLQLRWRFVKW